MRTLYLLKAQSWQSFKHQESVNMSDVAVSRGEEAVQLESVQEFTSNWSEHIALLNDPESSLDVRHSIWNGYLDLVNGQADKLNSFRFHLFDLLHKCCGNIHEEEDFERKVLLLMGRFCFRYAFYSRN